MGRSLKVHNGQVGSEQVAIRQGDFRWRQVTWSAGDRPQGRPGIGSSNHCAHDKEITTEVIVDWHPFEYYTAHQFKNGKHLITETISFEALSDGRTRVHDSLKIHMPVPRFIRSAKMKFVLVSQHHYDKAMALAAQLANEEFTHTKSGSVYTKP